MEIVLDTFSVKANGIPDVVMADYNGFISDCIKTDMHNNRMLMLYAIFLGLYYKLGADEFIYRYRHVRNVLNNSSDNIREEYMYLLLFYFLASNYYS